MLATLVEVPRHPVIVAVERTEVAQELWLATGLADPRSQALRLPEALPQSLGQLEALQALGLGIAKAELLHERIVPMLSLLRLLARKHTLLQPHIRCG